MPNRPPLPKPGSSYARPFELLGACHQRIVRSLDLLLRLCAHLGERGADAAARDAAADVLRYFDIAAPLHHQDEELHVFPALPEEPLCALLIAQHREIEALWQRLRAPLLELGALDAAGLQALNKAAADFVLLHEEHLRREDELVFPQAAARLDAVQQQAMGREMAARRG